MKLLFVFIFSLVIFPQHASEKISWQENQKLTWEDFRGTPIGSANFVANSHTGIGFQYSYGTNNEEIELNFSVNSYFYPAQSWYVPGKVSSHILKHEQAHFDISELHARILRKKISEKKFKKNIKQEIEAIYRQVEQKRRAMQIQFDAETDHSRNVATEIYWEKQIATQLTRYAAWK